MAGSEAFDLLRLCLTATGCVRCWLLLLLFQLLLLLQLLMQLFKMALPLRDNA